MPQTDTDLEIQIEENSTNTRQVGTGSDIAGKKIRENKP